MASNTGDVGTGTGLSSVQLGGSFNLDPPGRFDAFGGTAQDVNNSIANVSKDFSPNKNIEAVEATRKQGQSKAPAGSDKNGMPTDAAAAAKSFENIAKTVSSLQSALPAVTSILRSNIFSDVTSSEQTNPQTGNLIKLHDLIRQMATLIKNPVAFANQAQYISQLFPIINVNVIARELILASLGNVPFHLDRVPNLVIGTDDAAKQNNTPAGGGGGGKQNPLAALIGLLGGMMPKMGKLPTKNAKPAPAPKKLPEAKDPLKIKNLFAESAGAGAMNNLTQPVSSLMNMMATLPNLNNLLGKSPATTSLSPQKLDYTANVYSWGTGQYQAIPEFDITNKQMELSEKIETLTADILSSANLALIYTKDYQTILKIYPEYNESTTVVELLDAIRQYEANSANQLI